MLVEEGDDLLLINDGGTVMRTSVSDISTQGRDATGVRVMAVTGATRVAAAARILTTDDTDDTDGTVDPGVPGAGPASAGVVDGSAAAGGAVSEGGTGDGEDA